MEVMEETGQLMEDSDIADVKLWKIDCTTQDDVRRAFDIRSYPTILYFERGLPIQFPEALVDSSFMFRWIYRNRFPLIKLETEAEKEDFLANTPKPFVFGQFEDETTRAYKVFFRAGKAEHDFKFAYYFDKAGETYIDVHVDDRVTRYTDEIKSTQPLRDWVNIYGRQLVTKLGEDSFVQRHKSGLSLFTAFIDLEDAEMLPMLYRLAAKFEDKVMITYVDINSEMKNLAVRWGSSGNVYPTATYLKYENSVPTMNVWNENIEDEFNEQKLEDFINAVNTGTYERYIKSEPVPETQGTIIKAVGSTFEEIVHKSDKEVLLILTTEGCKQCNEALEIVEAVYKQHEGDFVPVSFDTSKNTFPDEDLPIASFPTLLWFPAEENEDIEVFKFALSFENVNQFVEDNMDNVIDHDSVLENKEDL